MEPAARDKDSKLYVRVALRCTLIVGSIVFVIFLVPRLVSLFFPFLVALAVAAIANPIVVRLNQNLKIPRRLLAVLIDLLVFVLISSVIVFLLYAVISQVISLATTIETNWGAVFDSFESFDDAFVWLESVLPAPLAELLPHMQDNIVSSIKTASKDILNHVFTTITMLTSKAGSFFAGYIISIMAVYFVVSDYDSIRERAGRIAGPKATGTISMLTNAATTAAGGYIRAQFVLATCATMFMLVAFLAYRQPYALLLALALGVVDLLPIVGTIAVLAPWGIIEFVWGDVNKGVFLLLIGIAYTVLRKFIEPKVMGAQMGLHPLVALMSLFVGLKISGIWGAVLGPMALMLAISIFKSGLFDNTIADFKAVADDVSGIFS